MGGLHTFSDITLTIHHNHYFIMKTKFLSLLLLLVMGLSASTATAQTQTPQPTVTLPFELRHRILRGSAAQGNIKFFLHGDVQIFSFQGEEHSPSSFQLYDSNWKPSRLLQPKLGEGERILMFSFHDVKAAGFNDEEYYYFTQTLFNDDEAYEFFLKDKDKNIHLINEQGDKLYTFLRPEGVEDLEVESVVRLFDKLYLVFSSSPVSFLYEINPQSKTVGIKQVAANAPMMSFFSQQPNHRSLRLDLAHPAKAGQTLVVTDMSGRRVAQQPLEAGQKQVSISTHRLPSATYNFTLLENGRVLENGKVIVQ